MSILTTLSALEQHLSRLEPHYAEARAARAELSPFATPHEVLAALGASSSITASERYAVVAALLAEHRERPDPLWPTLLLLAFAPMLHGLRSDLGPPGDEDRDQRVILAFLRAVETVPPTAGSYATVALRRATSKALFARARDEAEKHVSFNEEEHSPCDPFALTEAELRVEAAWAARRAARVAAEQRPGARVHKLPRVRGVAA